MRVLHKLYVHLFVCCRIRLTLWTSKLGGEEFRQLQRGDRLRDRGGREWIVRGPAYLDPGDGEWRVVLVFGAQVLIECEQVCDGYVVVPAASLASAATARVRSRLWSPAPTTTGTAAARWPRRRGRGAGDHRRRGNEPWPEQLEWERSANPLSWPGLYDEVSDEGLVDEDE